MKLPKFIHSMLKLSLLTYLVVFLVQPLRAIDINLAGQPTLISGSKNSISAHRFPTSTTFNGKAIDLILEITGKNSGRDSAISNDISWSVENNTISLWPAPASCEHLVKSENSWLDVKVTVVQKDTFQPISVDQLVLSGYDLDTWIAGLWQSVYARDYLIAQTADAAVMDIDSKLQLVSVDQYGTNGVHYTEQFNPYGNDCTNSPTDPRCNGSLVYANTSSIAFRVYTKTVSSHARLIGITFSANVLDKYNTQQDFSDAPESYGSAFHDVNKSIYLGNGLYPDSETNASFSMYADGDDKKELNAYDDDDGVTLNGNDLQSQVLAKGNTYDLTIHKKGKGYLSAWIDWNRDGSFSTDEQVANALSSDKDELTISLHIPMEASAGLNYMRFRFSDKEVVAAEGYGGRGEVEDYSITISGYCITPIVRSKVGKNQIVWNNNNATESYILYRSQNEDGSYEKIYEGVQTLYMDMEIIPDTLYYYKVQKTGSNAQNCSSRPIALYAPEQRTRMSVVPAMEHMDYAEIPKLLHSSQLLQEYVTSSINSGVKKNHIISHSPTLNSFVKRDYGVDFVLSDDTQNSYLNNNKPIITSVPKETLTFSTTYSYSYNISATDKDNDTLSFSMAKPLDNMYLDNVRKSGSNWYATLHWTPDTNLKGFQNVVIEVKDTQGAKATQSWNIFVDYPATNENNNTQPTIHSTPLQIIKNGDQYKYDVNATDADGDTLSYQVTKGPSGMSFVNNTLSWKGAISSGNSYAVEVGVSDCKGGFTKQAWTIIVTDPNLPPVIKSTPPTEALIGTQYYYGVEAQDIDGGISKYELLKGPSGLSFYRNGIYWTPAAGQEGTHEVAIKVIDNKGAYVDQNWSINVGGNAENKPPVITSIPIITVQKDTLYTYQVQASDTDGDAIIYTLDQAPDSMSINESNGTIEWLSSTQEGNYTDITLHVSDTYGAISRQSYRLAIHKQTVVNKPPVITSIPVIVAQKQNLYVYEVQASDADNDNLSFALKEAPTAMDINASTGRIEWVPPLTSGSYVDINLSVKDTQSATVYQAYRIAIHKDVKPNRAPLITSIPITQAYVNTPYNYYIIAKDDDNDTLSYTLENAPMGMEFNTTSTSLVWIPPIDATGYTDINLSVKDTKGAIVKQSYRLAVHNEESPNQVPLITSIPITVSYVDNVYVYEVIASDTDGDILTYSLYNTPAGMVIDKDTGIITWTPTTSDAGYAEITLRVSDTHGATKEQTYRLTVNDGFINNAPIITSMPNSNAQENIVYTYQVEAVDADNDPLTYELLQAPENMDINASGMITWLAARSNSIEKVSIRVHDTNGAQVTQTYSISIKPKNNHAPSISSASLNKAAAGELYRYDIIASDPDGDMLSYELLEKPEGMKVDANSSSIQWIPTHADYGLNKIVLKVSDPYGAYLTQSWSIWVSITDNSAPTIVSPPQTIAYAANRYIYNIVANDDEEDGLSYSLVDFPDGMQIDPASGQISWIPEFLQIGAHNVTVRVKDDKGAYGEQSFSLLVHEAPAEISVDITLSDSIIDKGESVTIYVETLSLKQSKNVYLYINDAEVNLDANGYATFKATVSGYYEVMAVAVTTTASAYDSKYFLVKDVNDVIAPEVNIATPTANSTLGLITDITGSVYDENLAYYELSIAKSGSDDFQIIEMGKTNKYGDFLGSIDSTLFANGLYTLKLRALDTNGRDTIDTTPIIIDSKAKIGNFSFTVTDFDIQVGGIPLQVNRTYSTLQRTQELDFGYGWSIDYQNVKVQENINPGKSWKMTPDRLIGYCFKPDASHIVNITLPDFTTESFEIKFARECGGYMAGSFYDAPKFYALNGSTAQLEASDSPQSVTINNSGEIIDSGGVLFNPSRYRLTLSNGMIYEITQGVGIKLIKDIKNDTLTYNTDGIISSRGESLTFERDSKNRITSITDLSGKSMSYHYDENDNLDYVIDQLEQTTTYTYQDGHLLEEYIDPSGMSVTKNYYDESGRLIRTVDADGNEVSFTHNIDGREEIISDKLGRTSVFIYDDNGNVLQTTNPMGESTDYTYDEKGNTLTTTDALGQVTTNLYDENGNLLSTTDAKGNSETTTYNSLGSPTTISDKNGNSMSIVYNAINTPRSITSATGAISTFYYDEFGNKIQSIDENNQTTDYEYDSNWVPFLGATSSKGNLLKETRANGTTIENIYDDSSNLLSTTTTQDGTTTTTSNTYDAFNRLVTSTDENGNTATHTYDARGNKTQTTDAQGRVTKYTYSPSNKLLQTEYPDATTESKTYDAMGNLLSETNQEGETTSYEYNGADRLIKTIYANGSNTSSIYDAVGRVTSTTDENTNTTSYTYDEVGNKTATTDALGNTTTFIYDAQGNMLSITDALGNTTSYEYNVLNQVVKTTYADGTTTQEIKNISGLPSKKVDENGNETLYNYNTSNAIPLLESVTLANGATTDYSYNTRGLKTAQIDALGHTTNYTYTDLGELKEEILPMGKKKTYSYDTYGKQTQLQDYAGKSTTFIYDSNDKLVRVEYTDGSSVSYEYTPAGRVKQLTDAQGTISYVYDSRGRVKEQTNPDGTTLSYSYDAVGNITEIQTPTTTTTKTYDALNRLSSVTDISGTTTYTYDAKGRQTKVTLANGTSTNYSYNTKDEITKIEHKNSIGETLQSFTYTLNAVGNRTKVVESNNRTTNYTYNSVNQLTSERVSNDPQGSNTTTEYTYDEVGNLLSKTVDSITTEFSYNNNDQLIQQGSSNFTYDANGNLTHKDTTTYNYDDKNRLIEVTTPTDTIVYTYDANNNRIAKTINANTTTYLVDNNTQYAKVLQESSTTKNISYTYGNDLLSQSSDSRQTLYYHTDALGSTRSLTNESQSVLQEYNYTPYGELLNADTPKTNYLYTGEQLDSETDDYYLRARYYSPQQARFTSIDPFEGRVYEPNTLNDYIYAGSNPVMFVDPSGESYSMAQVSFTVGALTTLGAISSQAIYGLYNQNKYAGNIFATIYIYDIQSFLRAELLPSVWLIEKALNWQATKLKNSTYNRHKHRCDKFPKRSDYGSDCAYYAALISHTESCIRSYENWDKKYNPGRHSKKIDNWKNTVKKNKKNYKRSCR